MGVHLSQQLTRTSPAALIGTLSALLLRYDCLRKKPTKIILEYKTTTKK
jgi:hypothetical protein